MICIAKFQNTCKYTATEVEGKGTPTVSAPCTPRTDGPERPTSRALAASAGKVEGESACGEQSAELAIDLRFRDASLPLSGLHTFCCASGCIGAVSKAVLTC